MQDIALVIIVKQYKAARFRKEDLLVNASHRPAQCMGSAECYFKILWITLGAVPLNGQHITEVTAMTYTG